MRQRILVVIALIVGTILVGAFDWQRLQNEKRRAEQEAVRALERQKRADVAHWELQVANEKHDEATSAEPPPGVIGHPQPQDGDAYLGVLVSNECGTIGSPTECTIKEVDVAMTDPDVGRVPASIHQLTFKIEGSDYETFACAQAADEKNDGSLAAWDCTGADGIQTTGFDVGQKYRFAKNGNVVTMRLFDERPNLVYFLLSLGACSSIHECQDVPRQLVFPYRWWTTVAPPDLRRRYDQYWDNYSDNQQRLHTPR